MEMGRAGNAFLKMASSSKVRHRPCGDGGMHTQDWQHATQNCPVPHAVNTLFSPNFYNKTLMKSKVRKEKHSFWNGTLWYMPATQEAEAESPEPRSLSPAWAAQWELVPEKGRTEAMGGEEREDTSVLAMPGPCACWEWPSLKRQLLLFCLFIYTAQIGLKSSFSCFSLLSTRNYVCTMPELNRIFFKDHHIQPRLASNQAPKLQKNLVSKKTKPRR